MARELLRIDGQQHDIGIGGAAPGGLDHRAVEPALWREDAGRVDEDELRLAAHGDAAHRHARGLHLLGDDGDLLADRGVDQRGLAGIGRAQHGDEPATRTGAAHSFQTPNRWSMPRGRVLLRVALGEPLAALRLVTGNAHLDREARRVVGAAALGHDIGRLHFVLERARLRPFLERGLRVAQLGRDRGERVVPIVHDEVPRRRHAAVEIERGDQRFAGAGQDRALLAPAARGFGRGHDQIGRQARGFRHLGAGFALDEAVEAHGEPAFGLLGMIGIQALGDDQAQHAVAEEFQALVGVGADAGVGEGARQQRPVGEPVAEDRFQAKRDCPHSTKWPSRSYRMAKGHFQTSQIRALPSVEKKMICALPTKFSNGT